MEKFKKAASLAKMANATANAAKETSKGKLVGKFLDDYVCFTFSDPSATLPEEVAFLPAKKNVTLRAVENFDEDEDTQQGKVAKLIKWEQIEGIRACDNGGDTSESGNESMDLWEVKTTEGLFQFEVEDSRIIRSRVAKYCPTPEMICSLGGPALDDEYYDDSFVVDEAEQPEIEFQWDLNEAVTADGEEDKRELEAWESEKGLIAIVPHRRYLMVCMACKPKKDGEKPPGGFRVTKRWEWHMVADFRVMQDKSMSFHEIGKDRTYRMSNKKADNEAIKALRSSCRDRKGEEDVNNEEFDEDLEEKARRLAKEKKEEKIRKAKEMEHLQEGETMDWEDGDLELLIEFYKSVEDEAATKEKKNMLKQDRDLVFANLVAIIRPTFTVEMDGKDGDPNPAFQTKELTAWQLHTRYDKVPEGWRKARKQYYVDMQETLAKEKAEAEKTAKVMAEAKYIHAVKNGAMDNGGKFDPSILRTKLFEMSQDARETIPLGAKVGRSVSVGVRWVKGGRQAHK
jgi:hypothetical protein